MMKDRRIFLQNLIYSFLLSLLGPAIANKFLKTSINPAVGNIVGKGLTKMGPGVIYAPYIPLFTTKDLRKPKWSIGDEGYLSKAYGINPDDTTLVARVKYDC